MKPKLKKLNTKVIQDKPYIGILCLQCNTVLVSSYRHDYNSCDCPNESAIDGGQEDYVRVLGMDFTKIINVEVDLINNRFKRIKNA